MTNSKPTERRTASDEEKKLAHLLRTWMRNPIDGNLGHLAQAMVNFELKMRLTNRLP